MTAPVHIHIGLPRTGLAAAQAASDGERAALGRAGIAFAETGVVAHHHFEVAEAFLAARAMPEERRAAVRAALEAEIAAARAPLLLSSEHFSDATEADIRAMAVFFGRGTRVIVSLRQPIAWAAAMYAEAVHGGHRLSFETFLDAFRACLDYEPLLHRWEAGFGRQAIRPLIYDRHPGGMGRALLEAVLPGAGAALPPAADRPDDPLPAPLVHLQRDLAEGGPEALALEAGLHRLWTDCALHGLTLPAEWRIPERYTRDFLALDRANDRISRDYGLPFPLFGRTVTALLEENRQHGYAAASPAEWLPGRRLS